MDWQCKRYHRSVQYHLRHILPEEQQKILRKEYQLRVTTVTFFLLAGIFICGFLSLVPAITLTYIKLDSYKEELSFMRQGVEEGEGKTYTSAIQAINDQVKILALVDQEHTPHKVFDSIIDNRGTGIRITNKNSCE